MVIRENLERDHMQIEELLERNDYSELEAKFNPDEDGVSAYLKNISFNNDLFLAWFQYQLRKVLELGNPGLGPVHRARDSHHYIFAIPMVKADYDKPTGDIYFEVAESSVLRSRTLEILSAVQHSADTVKLENICPSWVPNWECPASYSYLGVSNKTKFNAWESNLTFEKHIAIDGKVLRCSGIVIGTILSSTNLFTGSSPFLETAISNVVANWNLSPQYSTGLQRVLLFQRVLTANDSIFNHGISTSQGASGTGLSNEFAAYLVYLCEGQLLHNGLKWSDNGTVATFFSLSELLPEPWTPALFQAQPEFFIMTAQEACKNRHIFCTNGGLLGIGPNILQNGDVICILPAKVPFILRPANDYYLLVGECYVDSIMNGEKMDISKIETFNIH